MVSLFIKAWREENLKQRRDCLQALKQRSPLVELAFHTMTLRVSCDAKRRSDATLRVTPFAPQLLKFWNPQAHFSARRLNKTNEQPRFEPQLATWFAVRKASSCS